MSRISFITVLCILMLQLTANAQTTYNWNTQRTGNWDNPANWTPNGVPGQGDVASGLTVNDTVFTNGARVVAGFHNNGAIILTGNNGSLTVTGNASWSEGRIIDLTSTGNGTVTITSNGTLEINGGLVWGKLLEKGVTLLNQGTIIVSNGFMAIDSSVVVNEGVFEIVDDVFLGTTGPGNHGIFNNSGIIRKTNGLVVAQLTAEWDFFNQGGEIDIQSGSLYLYCGGTFTDGTYNADAGANLIFNSNDTYVFEGTLSGAPAGIIELAAGDIHVGSSGATLDFQGEGIQWGGSDFTGGGTLTISDGALMVALSGSALIVKNATKLLNLGTIRAESNFAAHDNSTIDNRGFLDITGDFNFDANNGIFMNSGTVRKSSGLSVAQFSAAWDWHNLAGGIIDAGSGTLRFFDLENAQGAYIEGVGTIYVPSNFLDDGTVRPGNSQGILTYRLDYKPSATGELNIELGGLNPGSGHDQLAVTGNAVLNGTIDVSVTGSFIPAAGDSFVVLTTTGTVSDSFMTINVQSGLYLNVQINSNYVTIYIDSVGVLSVEDISNGEIVTNYELHQNYPNPFNPSTNIQFSVPQSSYVTLDVYNLVGERVGILVSEQLSAGTYKYDWNASNLTSGIYFYRLQAADFIETKKMILLR